LADQLSDILGEIAGLASVPADAHATADVPAHVDAHAHAHSDAEAHADAQPLRTDVVAPDKLHGSLSRFAPEIRDGFFTVPVLPTHRQDTSP
jgi:Asp-tRNA(Asn)/Glu-tRNA(Gln) amidotransferase C subunit